MTDLAHLDCTAQAELVRNGDASPAELVDAAIERLEKVNGELNAAIHPLYDRARERARGPLEDGPFCGVPFVMKDLVSAQAGDPVHSGMRLMKEIDFHAAEDSYLAARFRAAGLVTIAKTNTPEWGLAATTEPETYGATRNPWNPAHSSGGSSGGSAAAVAARVVAVGDGGDGGGSLRIPASECGIVGLKPTRGRISGGPEYGELWHGFATEGVMSRSVRDMARFLDVMAGRMPGDPHSPAPPPLAYHVLAERRPGALRIGVMQPRPWGQGDAHPDCAAALEAAVPLLEDAGHQVEVRHPAAYDDADFFPHFSRVIHAHAARTLDAIAEAMGRELGADAVEAYTWHFIQTGRTVSAADYLASMDWIHAFGRRMASFWADDGFDLLLTPTIGEPPPPLGQLTNPGEDPETVWQRNLDAIPYTPAQNATGQPAVSLPLHWNDAGLPIGIQLVADFGREDQLLQVARQLERRAAWAERLPPICAA